MQCSVVQLILVYWEQTKPIISISAVLHKSQKESLSFDEYLKTYNYPEMRVFIIWWLLKPNGARADFSKGLLFYLPLCLIMVSYSYPCVKKKGSATHEDFLLWKHCFAHTHAHTHTPSPLEHQRMVTMKLPHFGIALLPPDPVITAHTRHQHYYSSNHGIIIPQNTSKRQLTFQGKNTNLWMMH